MRTREQNREYMRQLRSGERTARTYRKRGLDWSDRNALNKYMRDRRAGRIGKFEKLVAEYGDAVRIALTKVKLATMRPKILAAYSDLEPRQDRHCGGYVHNGHSIGGYHT